MNGVVVSIAIAPTTADRPDLLPEVRVVPGRGLEGDRYFHRNGTSPSEEHKADEEVTLVEVENIEEFNRQYGTSFTPADTRRNIATSGIRLNDLAEREFRIGEVRFKAHGLCEPCKYLTTVMVPEVLEGLLHKGGLRAQIISEGVIHVGDIIEPVESVAGSEAGEPAGAAALS